MKKLIFSCFLGMVGLFLGANLLGCSKGGQKVDVRAMTQALKSPDKEARANGCIELAKAGSKAAPAVSSLIPLLKDPDPEIKRLAAYALGEIGKAASPAIPALKEMLNDPNRDTIGAGVNALRNIDPKSASGLQIYNVSGR